MVRLILLTYLLHFALPETVRYDSFFCPRGCECSTVKFAERYGVKTDCVEKQLDFVPEAMSRNTIVLDLAKNGIVALEDTKLYRDYGLITVMNISDNRIVYIRPYTFYRMTKLKYLNLDGNPIRILPAKALEGAAFLETLSLRNTRLKAFPVSMFDDLIFLKHIDLTGSPVHCSCKFVRTCRSSVDYKIKMNAPCYTPAYLAGRQCKDISDEDAGCPPAELIFANQ